MNDIIGKMRSELRDILCDSVMDYTKKPRDKWLFDWSSQIILVVNQIFWCQEVEQVSGSWTLHLISQWRHPESEHTLVCMLQG